MSKKQALKVLGEKTPTMLEKGELAEPFQLQYSPMLDCWFTVSVFGGKIKHWHKINTNTRSVTHL